MYLINLSKDVEHLVLSFVFCRLFHTQRVGAGGKGEIHTFRITSHLHCITSSTGAAENLSIGQIGLKGSPVSSEAVMEGLGLEMGTMKIHILNLST